MHEIMKKVLLMSIGKAFGGVENTIFTLSEGLSDQYEFYFCARENTQFATKMRESVDSEHYFERPFSKKTMGKDRKALKKFCAEKGIELIHCHGIGALVCCGKRAKNTKLIYTIHGDCDFDRMERPALIRWVFRTLENRGMRRADLNIAVSEDIKSKVVARKIPAKKVKVVYNGIDLSEWTAKPFRGLGETPVRLMTMGRLEPVKGYGALIDAVALLKERNVQVKLDIFGAGREEDSLRQKMQAHQLDDIVSLKGFDANARDKIGEYDFYIQPSLYETFGIGVIEAMKAGVPTICSAVGGMREIVSDGENGFLIYGNRPEDIAEAVERAASATDERLAEFVGRANETLSRFDAQKTCRDTAELYDSLN